MRMFTRAGKIIAIASAASMLTITAAMAQEVYMEGTVLPAEHGYVLHTSNGQNYKLEGRDQLLSTLVPRFVKITGDLQHEPLGGTIKIKSVENTEY